MAAEVDLKLFGEPLVRRRLLRAAEDVTDHTDAFRVISHLIERAMDRLFGTQGASAGARWADLAPSTVAAKRRSRDATTRANAARVLMSTGRLRDSLTRSTGSDAIREIGRDYLRWGSRVPYGVYHQSRKPRKRLPHRPMRLSMNAKRMIVRELQRGLFNRRAVG